MGMIMEYYLLKPEVYEFGERLFSENTRARDLWIEKCRTECLEQTEVGKLYTTIDFIFEASGMTRNEASLPIVGKQLYKQERYSSISFQDAIAVNSLFEEGKLNDKHIFLKACIDALGEENNQKENEELLSYLSPEKDWVQEVNTFTKRQVSLYQVAKAEGQNYFEFAKTNPIPAHFEFLNNIEYYYQRYLRLEQFYQKVLDHDSNNWVFLYYH